MRLFYIKGVILSLIISFAKPDVFAQSPDNPDTNKARLLAAYNAIMAEDPFKRIEKANSFYSEFTGMLDTIVVKDQSFACLENIGFIVSPDERITVITWNIPAAYNENLYYGVIQYYSRHEKKYQLARLNDSIAKGQTKQKAKWSGALYYEIVETKHAGQRYYTLLGFDLHNPLSNKKLIDIVSIDDFDELYFCENLLVYQDKPQSRISFEYNEKAIMSLQYNEEMKMIVFDHLSPSRPSLEGQHEFYGPDFTYDGFKWEKGVWVHYSNIDVTN